MASGNRAHSIQYGNIALDVSVPTGCAPNNQRGSEHGRANAKYALIPAGKPHMDCGNEKGCDQDAGGDVPEGHGLLTNQEAAGILVSAPNDRLENSPLGIPAFVKAAHDGEVFNGGFFRPLRHRFANAIDFKPVVAARVVALLFLSSPSHVAGLVIAVIVNAFKAVLGRPFAHVFNKGFKAIAPALTNRNAPRSVKVIPLRIRAMATTFHHLPDVPDLRPAHHMTALQSPDTLGVDFTTPAAARLAICAFEGFRLTDKNRAPTITLANPTRARVRLGMKGHDDNPPVTLSGHISESWHPNRIGVQPMKIKVA